MPALLKRPRREPAAPLSIFVPHGATKLTDHELHGDGLVQWGLVRELARRGHSLAIAAPAVSIEGPIPDNVEIFEIDGGTDMSIPEYVGHVRSVYRHVRRNRPIDIVHQMNPVVRGVSLGWTFSARPVILGTYVGDWPHETPIARLRSGSPFARLKMAVKIALDALQQSRANRLLLTTPFALNRIPFPRSNAKRIVYVHHGLDVDRYTPEPSADDPAPHPHSVLYLGLLEPHKGIGTLLDAFDIVSRASPEARLIVAGDGSMRDTIHRRAIDGGWADRLDDIGTIARDRVPGWLRASTVLCSTSIGEPYGQGVVEAMACGRPVVVTASGGVRYLAAETDNPIVPPGDAGALAEALLDLLLDPVRAARVGSQNRKLAIERHAWSSIGDIVERTYRSALGERTQSIA